MSYEDPPNSRGPRRGRPVGHREPVTVVSISMDPQTLRDIDEESLHSQRSRSAFVRWVLASYIQLRRDERATVAAEREEAASFDPTHGGRFDPELIGADPPGPWACPKPGCRASGEDPEHPEIIHTPIVAGWLECHQCGTPRPAPELPGVGCD